MTLSIAIDVVLGLVFIYLLLALFCTSINEVIAGVLRLRARVLHSEIDRILDDANLARDFWQSGLIKSLGRNQRANGAMKGSKAPSYISSDTFAAALVGVLENKGESLTASISKTSPLYGAFHDLDDRASQSAEVVKAAVADWFDQVMDRASGVYKRNMQLVSFIVALAIAVALNADTTAIWSNLWVDDVLREEIKTRVSTDGLTGLETYKDLSTVAVPMGWGDVSLSITTVIGWLLTAFAITLGAPFWFDVLKRIVDMRAAGPQSETKNARAA